MFAVCIGVLLAAAITGSLYYFVKLPRDQHREHLAAAGRLFAADVAGRAFDPVSGLTTDQLEAQLKSEDLQSPCNGLTGMFFASCASYGDRPAQQQFAERARKIPNP
jgi:hypothetical protein